MILFKITNLLAGIPFICFWGILLLYWNGIENIRGKKDISQKIAVGLLCTFCWLAVYIYGDDSFWLREGIYFAVSLTGSMLLKGDRSTGQKIKAGAKTWICILILDVVGAGLLQLLVLMVDSSRQGYLVLMLDKNMYNILIYIIFVGVKIYSERKQRQRLLLITFISCVFAVGQVIFYYYLFLSNPAGLTEKIIGMTTLCSVIVLFVHGATLELMGKIIDNQERQNAAEKKLLEKKYEYDYYLLAKEQSEMIQKIRTDMWEQLQNVQELMDGEKGADMEQAEDMIEKLEKEVSSIGRVYYCDDAVLNTILALKQERASKLDIEMEIKVDSTVKTKADDIDLCCIITNLLDNAIESTERAKQQEKKESGDILVHIGHRGGYLAMKVENPAIHELKKNKKGRYSTSKENGLNEDHGRGLTIVEKTIEKYGGYMNLKKEENKVTTVVFLPEAGQ